MPLVIWKKQGVSTPVQTPTPHVPAPRSQRPKEDTGGVRLSLALTDDAWRPLKTNQCVVLLGWIREPSHWLKPKHEQSWYLLEAPWGEHVPSSQGSRPAPLACGFDSTFQARSQANVKVSNSDPGLTFPSSGSHLTPPAKSLLLHIWGQRCGLAQGILSCC